MNIFVIIAACAYGFALSAVSAAENDIASRHRREIGDAWPGDSPCASDRNSKIMCNKCDALPIEIDVDDCCGSEISFNVCEYCLQDLDDCLLLMKEFYSTGGDPRKKRYGRLFLSGKRAADVNAASDMRKRYGRLFISSKRPNKRYGRIFMG
ncbi:uncharacterized protein LOC141908924 [Tubulanus polymorphus]|uniref:uncharacterized protein LOC141908924 n=1 Tax=Tubulanus polymorphus TaxID=672921 RepID=UPI003DA600A6